MNKYAKLVNGVLFYAPSGMNNILGYNLDSNRERLLADGYKPVRTLPNKDRFVDCEGYYSFEYTETERRPPWRIFLCQNGRRTPLELHHRRLGLIKAELH